MKKKKWKKWKTAWYHNGTIWSPPPGWGETLLGRHLFVDFCPLKKRRGILISKKQKQKKTSKLIKHKGIFDLLTSGKESPRNFGHFDPKIIENEQF